MKAPAYCSACSGAPHHTILWFSNSSDIVSLSFARFRNAKLVLFLVAIGEWALNLLSKIFLGIGRLLKVFSLSDDFDLVTNARARVMWEEAKRRGISMRQVCAFGRPVEQYEVKMHGKTYIVDSIPVPPKKQREVLHIDDKISFKKMLRDAGVPAPKSMSVFTLFRAKRLLKEFGTVCVKPRSGSNGHHTYPYIKEEKELETAYWSAKQLCFLLSIEEHLEGNLCRATCIDGKLVGFLESKYPTVVGDGSSTIEELVAALNSSRAEEVAEIVMTDYYIEYIGRRGYTLSSVLPEGLSLPLTYRAGASSGGSNYEHGRNIHPSFIPLIEKAAVLTELPVVGFDLIVPDCQKPQGEQKWGFIEANSLPWINLHHTPFSGTPVNVAAAVWDMWG